MTSNSEEIEIKSPRDEGSKSAPGSPNDKEKLRLEQIRKLLAQLQKQKALNIELDSKNKKLTEEVEALQKAATTNQSIITTHENTQDGQSDTTDLHIEITRLQEMNSALENDAKRQLLQRKALYLFPIVKLNIFQEVEQKNEEISQRLAILLEERLELEKKHSFIQSNLEREKSQ
jgi:hypothetical protein